MHNAIAGKTGTTQNQADGWFIGYNPRIVVGIRVGANDSQIHFNSIALGQGANMALPIFGLFMQECLKSETYAYWSGLSFPMPVFYNNEEQNTPIFKENMNIWEKIANHKLEKAKRTDTIAPPSQERKGFFRRIGNLFKKKNKNETNER